MSAGRSMLVHAGSTTFFFSSRRRHTRCLSDWSSDVCSSDLVRTHADDGLVGRMPERSQIIREMAGGPSPGLYQRMKRSEERRVEKECRSRWSPDNEKKKKRQDRQQHSKTIRRTPKQNANMRV